ncbi:MAG TPA: hypothetical protein VFB84_05165, partial [Micromonosporaceae bacterium]|nr:hypothetical protein [Micromonosporaceae bacterium]
AHRYLAVREVMIECPFPNRQVDQLGLLDLPGLGEVDANADTRHVAGLRGEVDVVVMVLRPAEGIAYWRDVDNGALELLKEVRGGIGSARDFVFLAINDAEPDRVRLAGLRQSITSLANDETPDVHYRVLEADAHCPGDVHGRILAPVLLHLAERLPTMDREVFAAAIAGADTVLARIRTAVEDLETALRVLRQRVGVNESLHGHASRLRAMLAIELRHIVDDLRRQAEESAEDTEFVETLERTFDETVEWIQDGFGVGAETWTRRAFEDMAKLGNASAFAVDELNFIRVDISRRFAGLSDLFAGRVQAVWGQVAEALRRHLGVLLADADRDRPDEALRRFVELLNDAEEPCPTLAQAVSGLLDVRIDYQSQLYPRVRAALASLNQEIKNPATGEVVHQTAVEISEGGAEQLYTTTSRLAERAAHQAKRALLAESIAPTMILYAVVEHFADHLIRSRESEGEFRRLARSYRDDIWPAEFHQIGEANARVTRLRAAVREIASTLAELEKSL